MATTPPVVATAVDGPLAPPKPNVFMLLLSPLLGIISALGFDQPEVLRRNLLKFVLIPAVLLLNTFLASKGLPQIPNELVMTTLGGLVTLVLAAEAKAALVVHSDAKVAVAQANAGVPTDQLVADGAPAGTKVDQAAPAEENPVDPPTHVAAPVNPAAARRAELEAQLAALGAPVT